MKFEDQPITFTPKPLFENKVLRQNIFDKKKKIVDDCRPKEGDFSDVYSKEEIKSDLDYVNQRKEEWSKIKKTENEKYIEEISHAYEGVIAHQIEANAWFGANCESLPASEYDDIKNGVDVVTIFKKEGGKEYMGLGVDVTFASDSFVLEKKLKSIEEKIRSMSLPTLKYFQDPDTGEHKNISLPKVIVGSRLSSAENLVSLWGGDQQDRNRKLASHPVSSKIIMESIAQLEYFYKYAMNLSKKTTEGSFSQNKYESIAIAYGKMYNIFVDIYNEKEELITSHLREISDDIVYQTILEFTQKNTQE